MNADRLLHEFTAGEWFIDEGSIYAYLQLLQNYTSGKAVYEKPEIEAISRIIGNDGQRVNRDATATGYAYIEMIGAISRYGAYWSYGAEDYAAMLQDVESNPNIKGTILFIDGPGGAVSAINPLRAFKKTAKKPIIALVNTAASLHYWIAAEIADKIIAENEITARIGSIGIVATLVDMSKKYENEGIKIHEIYSPESEAFKNINLRLALKGEYEKMQNEELLPLHKIFQKVVKERRPMLKEEPGVLGGKTFNAKEAKRLGLIDAIGTKLDAIRMIDILSEINT